MNMFVSLGRHLVTADYVQRCIHLLVNIQEMMVVKLLCKLVIL